MGRRWGRRKGTMGDDSIGALVGKLGAARRGCGFSGLVTVWACVRVKNPRAMCPGALMF
jgi:hypothetical protein